MVCQVRLLRELQKFGGPDPVCFVFKGINGRVVTKSLSKMQPNDAPILIEQYFRYLSFWFSVVLGSSPTEFRKQFGTQLGRSVGDSAASNAGVALELIWVGMEHGTPLRPKSVT